MVMFRDYDADLKKEMERTSIHLSEECLNNLAEWAEKISPSATGRKLVDLKALAYYDSKLNSRFESIEGRIADLENAMSANDVRQSVDMGMRQQINETNAGLAAVRAQLDALNKQRVDYTHDLLMAQLNASNQQQIYDTQELLNAALQNYGLYKVDV